MRPAVAGAIVYGITGLAAVAALSLLVVFVLANLALGGHWANLAIGSGALRLVTISSGGGQAITGPGLVTWPILGAFAGIVISCLTQSRRG